MKHSGVCLIGPIAPPQWGPAVKNRILLDSLQRWSIDVVPLNTLGWKHAPIGFFLRVLRCLWKSRHAIVAVSQNGRMTLIPVVGLLGLVVRLHTVLMPAGGTFAHELSALPSPVRRFFLFLLKRFDQVVVERPELAEQLRAMSLQNVVVHPNFKVDPGLPREGSSSGVFRLLFLSRIRRVKGIESLLEALDILSTEGRDFRIDFYGIVQEDYEKEFEDMLRNRPYARYCGVIDYDKVIQTTADYDLMVFPTVVLTEGFPGVLADAAMAGLSVVASDVPSNREIIEDGVNGLLARPNDPADLAAKIGLVMTDDELRKRLAANNRIKGREYDVEIVLKRLLDGLRALGWRI